MRLRASVRRRRIGAPGLIAITAVMALAVPAHAVTLDDQVLTGKEGTGWDAEGDYTYGTSGGPCTGVDEGVQEQGFTPADDGSNDFTSDAFDGGLFLLVNGDAFGAGIEEGRLSGDGHQLKVGPDKQSGLQVRRTERALQTSPTLRSLITLRNQSGQARTVDIVWDSAMGADQAEGTRASSSGDLTHTRADRWLVASDNADSSSLSDPPVLYVLFGKGAAETVRRVRYAPEDPDPGNGIGEGCVAVRFRVTVPAETKRFLLFFTELGLDNEDATAQAAKYNHRGLSGKLLTGISEQQQAKVLNWDLV